MTIATVTVATYEHEVQDQLHNIEPDVEVIKIHTFNLLHINIFVHGVCV